MKRFFLVVSGVLFASQMALATSLRPNVRLEYARIPNSVAGAATQRIVVYKDGTVLQQACEALLPRPCPLTLVTKLNAYQMDRIERLIDRAEGGDEKKLFHPLCITPSMFRHVYTADNGQVPLRRGSTCSGYTINVRPEAAKLVKILDDLKEQAMKAGNQ